MFLLLVFLIPLLIIGIGNLWMKGQMDDSTVENGRIFLPGNKITSYIKATNKVEEFDLEEYVKGSGGGGDAGFFSGGGVKSPSSGGEKLHCHKSHCKQGRGQSTSRGGGVLRFHPLLGLEKRRGGKEKLGTERQRELGQNQQNGG